MFLRPAPFAAAMRHVLLIAIFITAAAALACPWKRGPPPVYVCGVDSIYGAPIRYCKRRFSPDGAETFKGCDHSAECKNVR